MLVSTLWPILTRWWRTDRIRVSPRDGELFRLTPDAVVIIRGVPYQIVGRRVVSLPGGAAIVYDCNSERTRCQLQVDPVTPRLLMLIEGESEAALVEDDLEIFPGSGITTSMLETVQLGAISLAAILDTALLIVLLERRNRPFARLPIVMLVIGAWLFHVGALLTFVLAPLPGLMWGLLATISALTMVAGLIVKPCALLHASVRLWRSGIDLNPSPNRWYALFYLPLVGLIPLAATIESSATSTNLERLTPWALPYVILSSAIHLLAAITLVLVRTRLVLPGLRRFFLLFAALLLVQSSVNVAVVAYTRYAAITGDRDLWFLAGVPSVAITVLFAYFLVRDSLFGLATDRAVVYGGFLASIAIVHQLAFQMATRALPAPHYVLLVFAEGSAVALLIVLFRPLRQRLAEALRYLMGQRVDGVRERLRELSMHLSLQTGRPVNEILRWFATELQAALEVEFVAGWLFRSSGDLRARFGDTRISEDDIAALARHMASRGVVLSYPPYLLGQKTAESFQSAGVSVAVRKVHQSVEGLLVVGRHAHGRDLSEEEASTVVLLVEQLTVALENSLLLADRLAAERRSGHLEKLSALGLMASSIAHEVKNPLSAIKTIAAVLAENLGPTSPHAEDVAMIRGEIDRLATTTQQLLEFSRPHAGEQRGDGPIQVEGVVSSIAQIMRRLAKQKDIAIETRFDGNLPAVRADETSLREIFFNLVANSLEAAGEGGRVTLICTRLNGHIVTEIRDSGPGLAAEVRARLFEPFVTTKAAGTGLGLYVVQRRVSELGGNIAYEEGPGGASFVVRIPAS